MSDKPLCPIRNDECLGRRCAMTVYLDESFMTEVLWFCGLVNVDDQSLFKVVVDREDKKQ